VRKLKHSDSQHPSSLRLVVSTWRSTGELSLWRVWFTYRASTTDEKRQQL